MFRRLICYQTQTNTLSESFSAKERPLPDKSGRKNVEVCYSILLFYMNVFALDSPLGQRYFISRKQTKKEVKESRTIFERYRK
jgi:hypothetical protein